MAEQQTEQFLNLLMPNQKRVFAFILNMVPHYFDAEDIMQETTRVIWRKFSEYQQDKDFTAWAVGIAYYEVLKYRKQHSRTQQGLSNEAVRVLYSEPNPTLNTLDDRIEVLQHCIRKLREPDSRLVKMRYEQGQSVKVIASQFGKSVQAIYKNMTRIHQQLVLCVNRSTSYQE